MDIELIKLVLMAMNMLASVAMYFYVRADREQRATVQSIKDLETHVNKRFDEKHIRLTQVECVVAAIPNRDQFDKERDSARNEIVRIHERIDELNKTAQQTQLLLGEVYGQLKQLNNYRANHD